MLFAHSDNIVAFAVSCLILTGAFEKGRNQTKNMSVDCSCSVDFQYAKGFADTSTTSRLRFDAKTIMVTLAIAPSNHYLFWGMERWLVYRFGLRDGI